MKIKYNFDKFVPVASIVLIISFYIFPIIYLSLNKHSPANTDNRVMTISIWGSFWNGLLYALISSVFQVLVGYKIAKYFTLIKENRNNKTLRILQAIIDSIVLLPYFIPSVCWKWISDELFIYKRGIISQIFTVFAGKDVNLQTPIGSYIILLYISIIHLFPFSYLTFRYFFSNLELKEQIYALKKGDNSFNYILKYHGKTFFNLICFTFVVRLIIMIGKFDLPYLFGGENFITNKIMVTLPVWMNMGIIQANIQYTIAAFMRMLYLLIILISIFGFGLFIISRLRRNIYAGIYDKFVNKIIIMNIFINRRKRSVIRLIIFICGKILNVITVTFACSSILSIIYILVNKIQYSKIPYIWFKNVSYSSAFISTMKYYLISIIICPFLAYLIFNTLIFKKGWSISILKIVTIIYYLIPQAVLFSFTIAIYKNYTSFFYVYCLAASIIPLIIFNLRISLPFPDNKEILYLTNTHSGFVKAYKKINNTKYNYVIRGCIISTSVIVVNELFGALHMLQGPQRPIAPFLWDAKEIFINDMSSVFGSVLPIVIANYLLIFILNKILGKNINRIDEIYEY